MFVYMRGVRSRGQIMNKLKEKGVRVKGTNYKTKFYFFPNYIGWGE